MKLTIPASPLAMWHAMQAAECAIKFADAWPDRKGRGQSVVYHVTCGPACVQVEVWRTAGGEISAVAEATEPLAEVTA